MGAAGVRTLGHRCSGHFPRLPGQHTSASDLGSLACLQYCITTPGTLRKAAHTFGGSLRVVSWPFPIECCVPRGEAAAVWAEGGTEEANDQ